MVMQVNMAGCYLSSFEPWYSDRGSIIIFRYRCFILLNLPCQPCSVISLVRLYFKYTFKY